MKMLNSKDTEWILPASESKGSAVSFAVQVDVFETTRRRSLTRQWSPAFAGYEGPLPVRIVDNRKDGWLSHIRDMLYSIPSVEDIFVSIEGNDVDVWVIIPKRDIATLHQLADIEWKLLEMFISGEHPVFLVDFHIIYRCGRDIENLAPTRAVRLPRQVR